MIKNQNFSDHNTIITIMKLKFGQKKKERIFGSLHDTEVPLYDINVENSHELWGQYSDILNRVTWDQVRGKSQNLEEKINIMYENILQAMDQVFSKKKGKQKGNKIPKNVRKSMRKKSKISEKMKKTRCPIKLSKLRYEMQVIEESIKNQ